MSKRNKDENSKVLSANELVPTADTMYIQSLELKATQLATKLKEAYEVNDQLFKKIKHLEELMTSGSDKTKFVITPEEQIAELQISRLLAVFAERTLTLDETRQYDLFVKNKRLSMSEPTTIEGKSSRIKDVTDTAILADVAKLKLEG